MHSWTYTLIAGGIIRFLIKIVIIFSHMMEKLVYSEKFVGCFLSINPNNIDNLQSFLNFPICT